MWIHRLSEGEVKVAGHDIVRDFRQTRSLIGLVPQELSSDCFKPFGIRFVFREDYSENQLTGVYKDLLKNFHVGKKNSNFWLFWWHERPC